MEVVPARRLVLLEMLRRGRNDDVAATVVLAAIMGMEEAVEEAAVFMVAADEASALPSLVLLAADAT